MKELGETETKHKESNAVIIGAFSQGFKHSFVGKGCFGHPQNLKTTINDFF